MHTLSADANCSVLVSVGVVPLLIALTRIDEKEVADRAVSSVKMLSLQSFVILIS